ncbi:MAG: RNA-directed DNA polymerase [Rikenellaceae bacterium]|nr:RNA-directed DNA polymerase [Rikenellaceae bacterium]
MLDNADLLISTPYKLTRAQLLYDLYVAFEDAARGKHKMSYVRKFEENLAENLNLLCDELLSRTYIALPSKCFIVSYPKKREIFAAMFRDRIVHHLYFNYTHHLYERTFIADSYSCIKGRGTHYGIERLQQHIRQASLNWQEKCYAMSLDIRGYFMHIDRKRLLKIASDSLRKMSSHRVGLTDEVPIPSGVILTANTTWAEIRDFDFLLWLTEQIVMLDPMENCIIVGEPSDWDGLDPAKCMRFVEKGLALPIGNLTSQLFSNVYLNIFDQYAKRVLLCRYYGRYVDDSVMIDPDREWLLAQVPKVREFLLDELGLELHQGKIHIQEVHKGVEFLGTFVKPYREYVSNRTLERMQKKLQQVDLRNREAALRSVNSYLGIMSHTASYNLRRSMFGEGEFAELIEYDADMRKGWLVA